MSHDYSKLWSSFMSKTTWAPIVGYDSEITMKMMKMTRLTKTKKTKEMKKSVFTLKGRTEGAKDQRDDAYTHFARKKQ